MSARFLVIAIAVSLILHLAAIALTLESRPTVEIAGGGEAVDAVLGQSPFATALAGTVEQIAASSPVEAVPVEARPIDTEPLEAIPVETAEPVEPVDPRPFPAANPVTAAQAEPIQQVRATALPDIPLDPLGVLATARPDKAVATQAAPETAQNAPVPAAETPAVAETVTARAVETEPLRPVEETAPPLEAVEAEVPPVPAPVAKPPAPPRQQAKTEPARAPAVVKKRKAPQKTTARTDSRAGAGGSGKTTAQKGGSQRKGRAKSAGNSDVTNYPALVHRKLLRSVRAPRGGRKARTDAVVRFTVRKNGAVAAIKLARSSGSAPFDKSVLSAVRRAAPFPPIPDAAGKSSWTFTLPVAMR